MRRGGAYALATLSIASASQLVSCRGLTHLESAELRTHLNEDISDNYYSSLVSFSDALNGLEDGYYTWATVKLYYSLFYSVRALLSSAGVCIMYAGNTPILIQASAGARPSKLSGTTHVCVLRAFRTSFARPDLLSQPMGVSDSLDWLLKKREDANYKNFGFGEPNVPDHFDRIVRDGIRRLTNAYAADASDTYTFDEDHAAVALPQKAIVLVKNRLSEALSAERTDYIRSALRDANGPLSPLQKALL